MKRKNGPRHTEVFHEAEYGQGRAPHHAFYLRRRGDKTVWYTPEEAAALYKALGQALARYRNEVTEHTDERCVHRISVYGRREGPFEVYRISGWGDDKRNDGPGTVKINRSVIIGAASFVLPATCAGAWFLLKPGVLGTCLEGVSTILLWVFLSRWAKKVRAREKKRNRPVCRRWREGPAGYVCGGRQARERPADECRARVRCSSGRPRHGCRFNRKNR